MPGTPRHKPENPRKPRPTPRPQTPSRVIHAHDEHPSRAMLLSDTTRSKTKICPARTCSTSVYSPSSTSTATPRPDGDGESDGCAPLNDPSVYVRSFVLSPHAPAALSLLTESGFFGLNRFRAACVAIFGPLGVRNCPEQADTGFLVGGLVCRFRLGSESLSQSSGVAHGANSPRVHGRARDRGDEPGAGVEVDSGGPGGKDRERSGLAREKPAGMGLGL